jgi:hypothetical protein
VQLPDNFYHHSPELHLAFICIDAHGQQRLDLVTVDAPDFESGLASAAVDMLRHGWNLDVHPLVFLGFAV